MLNSQKSIMDWIHLKGEGEEDDYHQYYINNINRL